MATRPPSQKMPAKATFSLISDDTFRQMYAAMVRLRGLRGENARQAGIEAVLASTSIQLEAGDLIFAETGLFPKDGLSWGGAENALPILTFGKHDDALLAIGTGAAIGLRATGGHGVVVVFCSAEWPHRRAWRSSIMNVVGQRLPILFVLMPGRADDDRAHAKLAAEALDAGLITIPVDAADAVAIYRVAFESLVRARRRTGATLIVATHYRVEGQRRKIEAKDPIVRMKAYLKNKGMRLTPKQS